MLNLRDKGIPLFLGAIILAGIVIVIGGGGAPGDPLVSVDGKIIQKSADGQSILFEHVTTSGRATEPLSIVKETRISDNEGVALSLEDIPVGSLAHVTFETNSRHIVRIEATSLPTIVIENPPRGALISSPILVHGSARAQSHRLIVELQDGAGNVLRETFVDTKESSAGGLFENFETLISFPLPISATGTIAVYEFSENGPNNLHRTSIPISFSREPTQPVKIYFSSKQQDPETADCSAVFPVIRYVTQDPHIGEATIQALLQGPNSAELSAGYFTNIPYNVVLKSLVVSGKKAVADFSSTLDRGVAGSCRVIAIRSQITETLKQFSNIKDVTISVEGITDSALQP